MKTILLYLLVFFSILNHSEIIAANQQTLSFFMEKLLPSMFFLCVLVQMLPVFNYKTLDTFLMRLFQLDSAAFFLILKGILIGNPAFAYMCDRLCHSGSLSQTQAQRFINCVAVPSISFMLMTLSLMFSFEMALTCFIIHLSSIFLLLLLTKKTPVFLNTLPAPLPLHRAILFTLKTMALILAYLFVMATLKSLILIYLPSMELMVQLFFEFSSGAAFFMHHEQALPYLLICFGVGGLCVHLQIMEGAETLHLNYLHYLSFRIIHVLMNLLIYFIFFAVISHKI